MVCIENNCHEILEIMTPELMQIFKGAVCAQIVIVAPSIILHFVWDKSSFQNFNILL